MRWSILALALASCAPDIAPGSYLCGDEQACPEGQACDGVTATCVLPSAVEPFACGDTTETEPNDAFASAQALGTLACVSQVAEVLGCTRADGNAEDWYRFTVAATCTRAHAKARFTFPIAFEPLVLELRDGGGGTRATAEPCANDRADDGTTQLCLDGAVDANTDYAFRVTGSGAADCGGDCAYNRYTLTMQLDSP